MIASSTASWLIRAGHRHGRRPSQRARPRHTRPTRTRTARSILAATNGTDDRTSQRATFPPERSGGPRLAAAAITAKGADGGIRAAARRNAMENAIDFYGPQGYASSMECGISAVGAKNSYFVHDFTFALPWACLNLPCESPTGLSHLQHVLETEAQGDSLRYNATCRSRRVR